MLQILPANFEKKDLNEYANTFFGFGSWNADCWLIGLEEYGCIKSDEFQKRYDTWSESRKDLVGLNGFFEKCEIENVPDWNNTTWQKLHHLCRLIIGPKVGRLSANNSFWGGNQKAKKQIHILP
jgi:hypothetical protein